MCIRDRAQAVRSGKALYVGLSNYDGPTLEKAAAILDELVSFYFLFGSLGV